MEIETELVEIIKDLTERVERLEADAPKKKRTVRVNKGDAQALVALYVDLFKARYGCPPVVTGKLAGTLKRLGGQVEASVLETLLRVYFTMTDPWILTRQHGIDAFEANIQKVAVKAATGREATPAGIRAEGRRTELAQDMADLERGLW